jgi:FimV-like protein
LFEKAEVCIELNDYKNAREVLSELKKQDANSLQALIIEASLLISDTKQYQEALNLLDVAA